MSRTIPSALLTALSQPEVKPYLAVEFDFDSSPIRLWTGYGAEGSYTVSPGNTNGISSSFGPFDLSQT